MFGVKLFFLKLTLSVFVCVFVCFSSPSRAISAAEASRRGCFEDILLPTRTGPLSGSLCLQEIQPACQRPHPMVSATDEMETFLFWTALKNADNWNLLYVVFNIVGSAYIWRCSSTHVLWCTLSQAGSTRSAPRSMNTQTPGRRAFNSW